MHRQAGFLTSYLIGLTKNIRLGLTPLLKHIFEIDLRALAVLRIGIGVLLIGDLFQRLQDYRIFYSDSGVLPRWLALSQLGKSVGVSLHLAGAQDWYQAVLFLSALLAAVCLVLGIKTRTACIVSWVLFTSIISRNPRVMTAGDSLMHVILLWGMWLPMGARYSISNVIQKLKPSSQKTTASIATAAIMLQLAMIYIATAILKSGPAWKEGTALYYALSLDHFCTPLARFLLGYPDFLKVLTYASYYLELIGPLALLTAYKREWIRFPAALAFMSLHVGIGLTMNLGFIAYLDILALMIFVPPSIWDGIERALGAGSRTAAYGREPSRIGGMSLVANISAGLVLLYMAWWTIGTIQTTLKPPKALTSAAASLKLNHIWKMFSPSPSKLDGWFIMAADLDNGKTIDLLNDGRPVSWERPHSMAATYPNHRHRKYRLGLVGKKVPKPITSRFVHYYKVMWDKKLAAEELKIKKVRLCFMEERTKPVGEQPQIVKKILWIRTK